MPDLLVMIISGMLGGFAIFLFGAAVVFCLDQPSPFWIIGLVAIVFGIVIGMIRPK